MFAKFFLLVGEHPWTLNTYSEKKNSNHDTYATQFSVQNCSFSVTKLSYKLYMFLNITFKTYLSTIN